MWFCPPPEEAQQLQFYVISSLSLGLRGWQQQPEKRGLDC